MAATPFLLSKTIIHLLLLAITLGHVSSARILDEVDPQPPVIPDPPEADDSPAIVPSVAPVLAPTNTLPIAALPSGPAPVAATSATTGNAAPPNPPLSFFMHDILGGSHPSARVVSGITANTQINGLPFSKANGGVFPINGGVPLLNGNNGLINNNNIPFLTGLNGGQTSTIIQNNGNNNPVNGGSNQPFVTAGQLPAGATLQKVMFGTITVIDDELTEGHELGSAVVGRAQGFYLASSLDGGSHTMVLTVLLHGSDHHQEEDTISFFGVHRTASPVSHIAVVGGTGEYENAKGYATIESLHQEDQHTTDGVETVIQVNVYLSH
ncbi:unnamed protein product, partial [Vitis vinifera]